MTRPPPRPTRTHTLCPYTSPFRLIGILIGDLPFKRIDLPTDSTVIHDVYRRMSAQRQQVASRLRAEGDEQSQTIRSEADRERTVILAEAERDAQKLRGE